MTLDLFGDVEDGVAVNPSEYQAPFQSWIEAGVSASRMRRESSTDVYGHMWSAFAKWAVGARVPFKALTPTDLATYLASRTRGDRGDLSDAYAWRLLRLIDRVWVHTMAGEGDDLENPSARLLAGRRDIRFANDRRRRGMPQGLERADTSTLIQFLTAARPEVAPDGVQLRWQDIRDRASVALMLGAGLAPGDVRLLELSDVLFSGGRAAGVPRGVRVPGNGNSPERETPIAAWASRLLAYWLKVREAQQIPGRVLFPATKSSGKIWGKASQYEAAEAVIKAAGLEDFALRQLRRHRTAADVDRVAMWLGVSDPLVMRRYLQVLQDAPEII